MQEQKTSNGIIPDTPAGAQFKQQIRSDQTLEHLNAIVQKLDTVEKALQRVELLMERVPGILAMTADMADDAISQADTAGISVDERLKTAFLLAERLTRPGMLEKLESTLQLADRLPGIVAMGADIADEALTPLAQQGLDLGQLARVSGAGLVAMSEAGKGDFRKPGGFFGVFRAMRDPDIQVGIGYFLAFLKQFGRNVKAG